MLWLDNIIIYNEMESGKHRFFLGNITYIKF